MRGDFFYCNFLSRQNFQWFFKLNKIKIFLTKFQKNKTCKFSEIFGLFQITSVVLNINLEHWFFEKPKKLQKYRVLQKLAANFEKSKNI